MSKSTQQLKDGRIIETVTRFNDSLTTNTRNSEGFVFSKHFVHYPDRLLLRPEYIQETTIDNYYAMTVGNFENDEMYLLGEDASQKALYAISLLGATTPTKQVNATFEDNSWLFYYKDTAFYYNGTALNYISDASGASGTPTEVTSYKTLTKANRASFSYTRPFIHPTDDYAYFFDSNNVYQLTDEPGTGTWTQASISIPSNMQISAACPYGEYIAIFAYDIATDNSTVFIWDRSLTLETFVDVKDWLGGEVYASATLGGNLVGVANQRETNRDILMKISAYTSSSIQPLIEISPIDRANITNANNEIVGLSSAINPDDFQPIYAYGKLYFAGFTDADGKTLVYELDSQFNLRTPFSNNGGDVSNIFLYKGTYAFTTKFNDFYYAPNVGTETLSTEGQYIPVVFDGNNGHLEKQPQVIRVWHSPILSGGSVKVEYWCITNDPDNTGDWVTVGTNTTVGSTRTAYNRVTSTNANMNQDQEHYYRVTVSGVSYIFGIQAESTLINNDI